MSQSVHPHVCGEISGTRRTKPCHRGSPPRVWGNLGLELVNAAADRFTPTCVGKSSSSDFHESSSPVHPHVCGEICVIPAGQTDAARFTPTCVGKSSSRLGTWTMMLRFTPTCVGKSANVLLLGGTQAVHPHVCGEIYQCAAVDHGPSGSPPRVWGNRTITGSSMLLDGSPPRVWGNQSVCATNVFGDRFTPTCVGKSGCQAQSQQHQRFTPTCVGKSPARPG